MIDRDHPFYKVISKACDEEKCGNAGFEILADRPLNHGHLVVCDVWWGFSVIRHVGLMRYRFIIDEELNVYVLDECRIRNGKRLYTIRGGCGEIRLSNWMQLKQHRELVNNLRVTE